MKRIVIVVGHSDKEKGARARWSNISEYSFNKELAVEIFNEEFVNSEIILKKRSNGLLALPSEINSLNPDYIISLHCNAHNEKTQGTETLYYHTSIMGQNLAEVFQKHLVRKLKLKDRGIKGVMPNGRGSYLLQNTKAPCIILEPFFIDSMRYYQIKELKENLKIAICTAIREL